MKFLELLDRTWLGTADKYDKPRAWNGAWPQPKTKKVFFDEVGGLLFAHEDRFRDIARSGDDVEVRGRCL
jgi:hypothetical protein